MIGIEHIADRSKSYGIPGIVVEGNDIFEVMRVTKDAVDRARSGAGPTLIEAKTYRWKGHSKSDAKKYRTREEEKYWKNEKDPIVFMEQKLMEEQIASKEELEQLRHKAFEEIEAAVKFAEESPMPSLDALEEDVYA
jgi:TPP-dependent pyruvate/acetoin dehydrogenase alpha subunit